MNHPAEQVAEKLSQYGHSEELTATKNLQLADLYHKQVLRFAQNDRENIFSAACEAVP